MPCNPADNALNPAPAPGFPIPGFGLPFAPVQVPVPNLNFPPDGFPEDILALLERLRIPWPGGPIGPQIDNFAADLLTGVMNLLSQIMPWLSFYQFILAALNLILCIIDVLCALLNPFKTVRAIRRLIKDCLPPFLNLFPWIALIAMIIALILLLLALIAYIIARILEIIRDLLANLALLAAGITLQDAESTVAVAFKIASLLCIIENLMAMLAAIGVILAIIETLSGLGGFKFCGSGGDSGISCCGDDVCPPFIRNNPDGISGASGRLVYHRQIIDPDQDDNPGLSRFFKSQSPTFTTNSLRSERWQFVNDDPDQEYPFSDIIRTYTDTSTQRGSIDGGSRTLSKIYEEGDIFWPEGISFSNETAIRRAPYFVDITLPNYNPDNFDSPVTGETRTVFIEAAIVQQKPYIGIANQTGSVEPGELDNVFGTLSLVGGKVYEEDKSTPILDDDGKQITLEQLIHQDALELAELPDFDDGYEVDDLEFTLNINHGALLLYNLTVAGCVPDISIESQQLNDRYPIEPVITIVGNLPDVNSAQQCVSNALTKLRKDVTEQTVLVAQQEILDCLFDLQSDAYETLCNSYFAGTDPYSSTFEIDPDLQFVNREIEIHVVLRDRAGVNLSENIPDECANVLAAALEAEVTFGTASSFSYDRDNGRFVATISTDIGGSGELRVSFQGNIFVEVLNQDNPDVDSVTQERFLPYEFVGAAKEDPGVRRDATDVANNVGD